MSKIIPLRDTITITVENFGPAPGRATMQTSRELPAPVVAGILAALISQLMQNLWQALQGNPFQKPPIESPDDPPSPGVKN